MRMDPDVNVDALVLNYEGRRFLWELISTVIEDPHGGSYESTMFNLGRSSQGRYVLHYLLHHSRWPHLKGIIDEHLERERARETRNDEEDEAKENKFDVLGNNQGVMNERSKSN